MDKVVDWLDSFVSAKLCRGLVRNLSQIWIPREGLERARLKSAKKATDRAILR
jgi:hypothetical protein